MRTEKVYQVTTEGDCEGRTIQTVGYAVGNPEDIKVFYNDKACYSIRVHPVTVVHVTPEAVAEKKALLEERVRIKQRLDEIGRIMET